MNKKLLMSYEEYASKKWEVPYSYTLEKVGQCLYYFGSRHSRDPGHPQFPILRNFFEKFLAATEATERIVVIEGGVIDKKYEFEEEMIIDHGETQLVNFFAKRYNISVISPEPREQLLLEPLMQEYSLDYIAYYFFARTCAQWNRIVDKPDFDKYINGFLIKNLGELQAQKYFFPKSELLSVHKELFSTPLDIYDNSFFSRISSPIKRDTIINDISRATTILRDIAVLEEIEKQWKAGKSIFIIYGATHAVMQELAIRSLLL